MIIILFFGSLLTQQAAAFVPPLPNNHILTSLIQNSAQQSAVANHVLFGSSNNDEEKDDSIEKNNMSSDDDLFRESIESDNLSTSDSSLLYGENEDDDDDEDDEDTDPYAQSAPSEFNEVGDGSQSGQPSSLATALARQSRELNTTPLDWGGALTTLRDRVSDIESGKSTNPSTALFRTISRERPNEAIGRFVREANPEVVSAMTGAVGSLLGSLSNPSMGIETIVQASSEKLASLCFRLQMTGYLFRNVEYVMALKKLMNIRGATIEEYKAAFQRLDTDGSGYLERDEIEALLADVYEGKPPAFEINTFLQFFDSNNDGRVSWEEFEKGFGVVAKAGEAAMSNNMPANGFSLPGGVDDDEEDDLFGEPSISGTIKVELDDGKIIELDAQEYVNDLKQQAIELKRELAQEKGIDPSVLGIPDEKNNNAFVNDAVPNQDSAGGIAGYIASLQGDVESLTKGISPEVVDAMKMLIDFVLEGPAGGGKQAKDKKKEMELPGSALQQLALWQLVIGYRLRETEATGEWKKMLD